VIETRKITGIVSRFERLKAPLHGGIFHGTSHGISHGILYITQKVRGTSRVNGGLSVGITEYDGISHGMSVGISHRVNGT
jgi:hypothetical protein